jgi:hypothetical protein
MSLGIYVVNLESVQSLGILVRAVANLGDEASVCDGRVQYVVDVDGQKLKKALLSCSRNRVGGVVRIRPCIRAVGEPAIREMVDDALVRVLLRAEKH